MSAATLSPPDLLETARARHAQNQLLQAAHAYRQTLEIDPQSQPALLGLSLIARQSNQLQPALRMAQAALAAGPQSALAWANYGDLLLAAQGLSQAQSAYRRALTLDQSVAVAHYGLANTYALQENYPAALPHFDRAAQLNPTIPEFHFAHAFAHGRLGQHAEAIAAYRRAAQLRPNFASAWLNLGVELIADGRDSIAELCYAQALACATNPDTQISTQLNHGHLLRSRKHFAAARARYQSALNLAQTKSPTRQAEAHVAFTYLHLEQQQFKAAWQSLQAAESLHQPNPEIPNVRGILLLAQHAAQPRLEASEGAGGFHPLKEPPQESRASAPDFMQPKGAKSFVTGHDFNLAENAATKNGVLAPEGSDLLDHAIQAFHQAELQGHKTAPSNRGNALLRQGRVDEALAAHRLALARDPHHPGVRYNLALTQLRAGNFEEGWQNYEIRWQFREVHPHPRRFPQPRWRGEPLPESAVLFLYAEQGLGDTIQFLRYLQLLPNVRILLEVQPPLTRLIAHSLTQSPRLCPPERNGVPTDSSSSVGNGSEGSDLRLLVISQGDPIPRFTHHIPLMSLPALFQTTLKTIPTPIPYLPSPANPTKQGALPLTPSSGQRRDQPIPGWDDPLPRIGLHWAGNPNYRADRERSTQLQTFLPLLKLPQFRWVSLQKGPAAQQIAAIPSDCRSSIHDACSQDRDLADTAAHIAPLHLVLTTDSAVAHLAGAMGKPLWLLLPWQSDWRWMQNRPDTPWYPQARLFRQSSPGNWPELIARVAAELQSRQPAPAAVK